MLGGVYKYGLPAGWLGTGVPRSCTDSNTLHSREVRDKVVATKSLACQHMDAKESNDENAGGSVRQVDVETVLMVIVVGLNGELNGGS